MFTPGSHAPHGNPFFGAPRRWIADDADLEEEGTQPRWKTEWFLWRATFPEAKKLPGRDACTHTPRRDLSGRLLRNDLGVFTQSGNLGRRRKRMEFGTEKKTIDYGTQNCIL